MMFNFGDIVVVNFPFTNNSGKKKRPAVVISSSDYNSDKEDLILLAITSKVDKVSLGEALITAWREAGLLKPSAFKSVVFTTEKEFIFGKLGSLVNSDIQILKSCLKQIIEY